MQTPIFSLFVILLLGITPIWAQLTDSSLQVIAYWPNGDEQTYDLLRQQIQVRNGDTTKNTLTNSGFTIRIADSTEERYTLAWQYQPSARWGEAFSALPDPSILSKIDTTIRQPVLYTTYPEGDYEQLLNWAQVQRQYRGMMQQLVDLMLEANDSLPNSEAVMNVITRMEAISLSSPDNFRQYYLKEQPLYHTLYGTELILGDTLLYEEEVANPLGGAPMTGEGRIYVRDIDEAGGQCTLVMRTDLDPDAVKAMTQQLLTNLMSGNLPEERLAEARAAFEQFQMEVSNQTTFTFDTNTFWLDEVNFHRITRIRQGDSENGLRVDHINFRRK